MLFLCQDLVEQGLHSYKAAHEVARANIGHHFPINCLKPRALAAQVRTGCGPQMQT
jgi:hypothetical protein